MRAIERDRLLARAAWIYLVGLAAVTAFYLWPRPMPEVSVSEVDLAALSAPKALEFDAVESLTVQPTGATPAAAVTAVRRIVAERGGDAQRLVLPIADRAALFDALAQLRAVSSEARYASFLLVFGPSGASVQLESGRFDDPDGRIGAELLKIEKARAETATATSTTGSTP